MGTNNTANSKITMNPLHRYFSLIEVLFDNDIKRDNDSKDKKQKAITYLEIIASAINDKYADRRNLDCEKKDIYGHNFDSAATYYLGYHTTDTNETRFLNSQNSINTFKKIFDKERFKKTLSEKLNELFKDNKIKFNNFLNEFKNDDEFNNELTSLNVSDLNASENNDNKFEKLACELADLLDGLLNDNPIRNSSTSSSIFHTSIVHNKQEYEADRDIVKFIYDNKYIIIEGEGGLGKSTFLKSLTDNDKVKENFDYFPVFISLASLAAIAQNVPINSGVGIERFKDTDSSYICTWVKNNNKISKMKINSIFCDPDVEIKDNNALLLLDGFNELSDVADYTVKNQIISEIRYLLSRKNIWIMISSRIAPDELKNCGFVTATISGTPDEKCKEICENFNDGVTEEVRELAKIPMYYSMLYELYYDKTEDLTQFTKYEVLDKTWDNLYKKSTINSTAGKHSAYYCFAPELALNMVISRKGYRIAKNDAVDILNNIDAKQAEMILSAQNYHNTDWIYDGKAVFETLYNDNIIKAADGTSSVGFIHQDWQDYLAARCLFTRFTNILNAYNDSTVKADDMLSVNLNVTASVTKMFLQAQGIQYDNADKCCEGILQLLEPYSACGTPVTDINKNIVLVDALCQLTECIPSSMVSNKSDKYEIVKEKLSLIINNYFEQAVELELACGLTDTYNQLMINIIAKQTEYLRRKTKYADALKWVEYGEKLDRGNMKLLNQEGKVYMHYAQSKFRNEVPDEEIDISPEESFRKGLDIIKENATKHNNMSSNLLALILSTPAPYISNNLSTVVRTDYVTAFWTYFDVMKDVKNRGKGLVYSLRQCAALLIKGYVKVNMPDNYSSDCILFLNNEKARRYIEYGDCKFDLCNLNKPTISLAEDLLSKIAYESNDAYIIFLQGCLEYAKNNLEKANKYFMQSGFIQGKIIMMHSLTDFQEINEKIKNDKKAAKNDMFGEMDKCYPGYYIDECKKLLAFRLAYLKGNDKTLYNTIIQNEQKEKTI